VRPAAPANPAGPGRSWPERGLTVDGPPGLVRHFAAEYGPGSGADPGLERTGMVTIRSLGRGSTIVADRGPIRSGSHKTTRWRTRLSPSDDAEIAFEIEISGVFGRSLVQSLIVEPLLSVVLARRDRALFSASGIVIDGRTVAICGLARSGKTTLALRAWATGRTVLADDRLMVAPDGLVTGFTRRPRVYPDLVSTAPAAVGRLGPAVRRRLAAASVVKRLTLGFIGLPVLLDRDALGSVGQPAAPLADLVIIDRAERPSTGGDDIVPIDSPAEVERQLRLIAARDLRWVEAEARGWENVARATADRQVALLLSAMTAAGGSARVLVVPAAWDAARAIQAIAREIGLE
jgi:hypothetical protein